MHKTSLILLSAAMLTVWNSPAGAQTKKPLSDNSIPIAETNRLIEEQKKKNGDYAANREKLLRDSAIAAGKADERIAALSTMIQDLLRQVGQENASRTALTEELSALEAAMEKETGARKTETDRLHDAISKFEPDIVAGKKSLKSAQDALDLVRSDSAGFNKINGARATKLTDSLKAMEKSLAATERTIDSLSAVKKKMVQDSTAERRVKDDSLKAAIARLQEVRRILANGDSVVKNATDALQTLKKDSSAILVKNREDVQIRDSTIKIVDSIVKYAQDEKTKLLRKKDKFLLDSAIQELSAQLKASSQSGDRPDPEKTEILDNLKIKMENILRDQAFAASIASLGKDGWQNQIARINSQLVSLQKTIDSASLAGQKIVQDGMAVDKQFLGNQKKMAEEGKARNLFLSKAWRDLINKKPLLTKAEEDSAAAAKAVESTTGKHQKKLAAITAESATAAAKADGLTRGCDSLKKSIAENTAYRQKVVDSFSIVIATAAEAVKGSQTELNSVLRSQQASRDDSVAVDKENIARVDKASQALEVKKGQIKDKGALIQQINARISQTRTDSGTAAAEKLRQQTLFKDEFAEQSRLISQGEKSIADMERDRAKLEKEQRAFELETEAAAESERQELLARKRAKELEAENAAQKEKDRQLEEKRAKELEAENAVQKEKARQQEEQMAKELEAESAAQKEKERQKAEQQTKDREAKKAAASEKKQQPAKSASTENAESILVKIYNKIEAGDIEGAQREYNTQRNFLKQNLDKDAFEGLGLTLESLAPPPPAAEPPAVPEPPPAPPAAPIQSTPEPEVAPAKIPVPEPAPEQDEPRVEASVNIYSIPPAASMYMDGQFIGKTNSGYVKVTSGKHRMRFMKGELTCDTELTFAEGVNPVRVVRLPCKK